MAVTGDNYRYALLNFLYCAHTQYASENFSIHWALARAKQPKKLGAPAVGGPPLIQFFHMIREAKT